LSKFHGIVCVAGAVSHEALVSLASAQVAPFDTYNGGTEAWDWWELPGPRGHSFPVKPQCAGDPRLLPVSADQPGRCQGGPVSALDLDAFDAAAASAAGSWRRWHSTPDAASALPLSHFFGRIDKAAGYTVQQAREDFGAQPPVRDHSGPRAKIWHEDEDPVHQFRGTLDDYLERQAGRLLRIEAFVTEAGDWLDNSAFGDSQDDFSVFALKYLRQASDDVSALYLHFHS
jgi:hypothetical protein